MPLTLPFTEQHDQRCQLAAQRISRIPGDLGHDLMHALETHGELTIDSDLANAAPVDRKFALLAIGHLLDLHVEVRWDSLTDGGS